MIRTFFAALAGAWRDAADVARALPVLLLLMAGIEFAQHVVEVQVGLFAADEAVRKAAADHPARMALGWPKMLLLYMVGLVAIRWLVARDRGVALRPDATALRRMLGVLAFQFLPPMILIYAPALMSALGPGAAAVQPFRSGIGLAMLLLEPLLLLWFVNAAMGTSGFGPLASAKATGWLYVFGLLLLLAARVPPSALHRGLNLWAMGQPAAVQWLLLALDALLVGALALVVPAAQVRIARFIAERRSVPLLAEARGVRPGLA